MYVINLINIYFGVGAGCPTHSDSTTSFYAYSVPLDSTTGVLYAEAGRSS